MRILNLYAGIGGNRRLWGNEHNIDAVELNENIAAIYKEFFPNDNVIVSDAHEYLLQHYKEYDLIWSSPPCPTHSDIRRCGVNSGQNEAVYPDMKLYQEIILLMYFAPKNCKWVVENVKPYYDLLIPGLERGRHIFWSNFYIHEMKCESSDIAKGNTEIWKKKTGFNLDKFTDIDKRKTYRNCVDSKLAKHVFDCAFFNTQEKLF